MVILSSYIEKLEKDRPNGRCRKWRLWVRTSDGRRSRRFHGTFREAQAALSTFRDEVEATLVDAESFASYADSWASYRRSSGSFAPGTLANDAQHVGLLKRHLGGYRMDAITPAVVRQALVDMRASRVPPLSGTYMNKVYTTLHSIMLQAYRDGRIARDPMDGIPAPKVDTAERAWLEPAQLAEFARRLSTLPLDGRTVACYLMAYLGLRRGEACALYVDDVDIGALTVHVRRAVKERNGAIDRPKSDAGIRDLPMPGQLADVLRAWIAERVRLGYTSPTLACSSADTVLRPQNLQKWWDANRAELGADGMTLHQIRHSNLSMMARHMSVFDLQRWAGWSSIEPAKVYVHADDESMRTASGAAFQHHFSTRDEKQARA